MPPAIDLTSRRFGKLTVLRVAGWTAKYGGCRLWLCRCDCGAEIEVPQKRLPYAEWIRINHPRRIVEACPSCEGGQCKICGATIPRHRLPAATCPGACADVHRKARGRANWRKRLQRDPDLARKMARRRRERAAADLDFAKVVHEYDRRKAARHRQRMATDPEYAARHRARANARYALNAARIQAERRARLDAMTPAERQEWAARARAFCRRWRRKWYAELKKDSAAYRRFRELTNEYQRIRYEEQRQPPVERSCVVCGAAFSTRKFRVLCGLPECKAVYLQDNQRRYRARKAMAAFLRTEVEIARRAAKNPCPDRC